MSEEYTYAVARIHAKEISLLSIKDMERLLSASGYGEALSVLAEKGYDTVDAKSADELLNREREKTHKLISELVDDMSVFNILFYENDFHNLKAAVKSQTISDKAEHIFVSGGTVPKDLIVEAVKNREFDILPEFLRDPAQKALKSLMETRDGGLCDVIIDKAYLDMLIKTGEESQNAMINRFAELSVALADVRIAVRGSRLGKSLEFFRRSLANCKTISADSLAVAAAKGVDELDAYLKTTDYADAAEIIKESYVAFEKWCDDKLMSEIRKEKSNNFTIAPLAAYILARETELKMVGLILTAKQNKLGTSVVKERLRELYV